MDTRRQTVRLPHALAYLLLLPLVQATLAGTVKDTSKAARQDLTAQLCSPMPIERTRSAVMDGAGQCRITGFRLRTDGLTFSLPGFTTSLPNLTPYQPSGWSESIVISKATGTSTDSSPIYTADTLYVDWAVINNGTAPAVAQFFTKLYVDGVERGSWFTNPPLDANFYGYYQDFAIGSLSAGQHTIRIVTDVTGVIAEANEVDNEYTKSITVGAQPTPIDFIQALPVPEGVATDPDGNIYVIHDDGNVFTNNIVLTKFSPSGAALGSVQLGTFFDKLAGAPRLSLNPANGKILAQFSNGKLKEIAPATLAVQDILNLRNTGTFSFTPGAAYATTGTTRLQNFNVFPSTVLTFGDMAALAQGDGTVDLFLTAWQSDVASTSDFVIKVTLRAGEVPSVRILIISNHFTSFPDRASRRGIAVNSAGKVLTVVTVDGTLKPFATPLVTLVVPATFSAGFSPGSGDSPQILPYAFDSDGMTADAAGNVYALNRNYLLGSSAFVPRENFLCFGSVGGELFMFPSALTMPLAPSCFSFGIKVSSIDAAVRSSAGLTYVTVQGLNKVVRFETGAIAPPAPAASAATNVTSGTFTANWNSSGGATGYRLDVSTSNTFGAFVSGYHNLDIGNVTSHGVSGLSANTTYYYRVRAYNNGGTSSNSNVVAITTTGMGTGLRIDAVIPAAGRVSGGQQVTLTGSFTGLSAVTFGGTAATINTIAAHQLVVTTPAHARGAVSIELIPASGITYTKPVAFGYLSTTFTDDSLVSGVTPMRAQHILELRQAVEVLERVANLPAAQWTDPQLTPFSNVIKAAHVVELRARLEEAVQAFGYAAATYTDQNLSAGLLIKRVHIEELRQRLRLIAG